MKRRQFIQSLAGSALAATPVARSLARAAPHVVVIGAGIVGSSIAWHLVRRGAKVTVIERNAPASGTSGRSFAWINAHYSKQPQAYHQLSARSLFAYRDLQRHLPLNIHWGGGLEWLTDAASSAALEQRVLRHQRAGMAARMVSPEEVKVLEPNLVQAGLEIAAYSEPDGGIDAADACRVFIDAAQSLGANVIYPREVLDIQMGSSSMHRIETDSGTITADKVVIACGPQTNRVAKFVGADVPLIDAPGVIATTRPMPHLLNTVVWAPGSHMQQRDNGRIVIGEQGGPSKSTEHLERLSTHPQSFPDEATRIAHGERLRAAAVKFLPQLQDAQFERITIGWRPMPKDRHPIIGRVESTPDAYLAVTHSGVSLAPIIGRIAALEILDDIDVDMANPFRLTRFSYQ
jgi:glycine/D-amino acid oxidase-like deaminating enzyme